MKVVADPDNDHQCTFSLYQWFELQGWMQFANIPANRKYMKKLIQRCMQKFPTTTEISPPVDSSRDVVVAMN